MYRKFPITPSSPNCGKQFGDTVLLGDFSSIYLLCLNLYLEKKWGGPGREQTKISCDNFNLDFNACLLFIRPKIVTCCQLQGQPGENWLRQFQS